MTCSACAIFTLSLSPLRIHFEGSAATQGIPHTTKTMKITVISQVITLRKKEGALTKANYTRELVPATLLIQEKQIIFVFIVNLLKSGAPLLRLAKSI